VRRQLVISATGARVKTKSILTRFWPVSLELRINLESNDRVAWSNGCLADIHFEEANDVNRVLGRSESSTSRIKVRERHVSIVMPAYF